MLEETLIPVNAKHHRVEILLEQQFISWAPIDVRWPMAKGGRKHKLKVLHYKYKYKFDLCTCSRRQTAVLV